jgi:hypothetical protein
MNEEQKTEMRIRQAGTGGMVSGHRRAGQDTDNDFLPV